MRLGFHISIAGGLSRVLERADARNCETIQLFSRNPRGWRFTELDLEEARALRSGLEARAIAPIFVHLPYLANLASPDPGLRRLSVASLTEELHRAYTIGAGYVVVHVGRRLTSAEGRAMDRVATGINRALTDFNRPVGILLETTSGMGSEVGYTFGQIGRILDWIERKRKVGVCLDTAHVFQAGYDISSAAGLEKTVSEFEERIGLGRLRLVHLNDSRTPLGSRIDRHWHIGRGHIGERGFRRLLRHPAFAELPAIMETPRKTDSDDLRNLKMVKRLSG